MTTAVEKFQAKLDKRIQARDIHQAVVDESNAKQKVVTDQINELETKIQAIRAEREEEIKSLQEKLSAIHTEVAKAQAPLNDKKAELNIKWNDLDLPRREHNRDYHGIGNEECFLKLLKLLETGEWQVYGARGTVGNSYSTNQYHVGMWTSTNYSGYTYYMAFKVNENGIYQKSRTAKGWSKVADPKKPFKVILVNKFKMEDIYNGYGPMDHCPDCGEDKKDKDGFYKGSSMSQAYKCPGCGQTLGFKCKNDETHIKWTLDRCKCPDEKRFLMPDEEQKIAKFSAESGRGYGELDILEGIPDRYW